MSKPIKVRDETYEKLKFLADEGYRSLGGEIDYLIYYFGVSLAVAAVEAVEKESLEKATPIKNIEALTDEPVTHSIEDALSILPRSKGTVLDEINRTKQALDAERVENDSNQDPDYWADFEVRSRKLQALWTEYRSLG